jgi:UDP-N-acetylmuramoyl-tripeptide--D-alanyl-D-alanine ligase
VLEIGTNHPGEVRALSEMALPDIAVITSIAAEHLEGLGDIDGVRREEADLIAGLNPRGTLIVNGDDEKILSLLSRFPGSIITFGFARTNDLVATDVECLEMGVRFRINNGRRFFVSDARASTSPPTPWRLSRWRWRWA